MRAQVAGRFPQLSTMRSCEAMSRGEIYRLREKRRSGLLRPETNNPTSTQ